MSLLLESIKIQNRIPQNLEGHNTRLNKSRSKLFGLSDKIDLRDILKVPGDLTKGVYKCRVIYAETIRDIEFVPYTPRIIETLELVNGDNIEYEHKYLDKTKIEHLKNGIRADDILIVKGGRITDASFANVVFLKGDSWITPAKPLLKGTKRQYLLDSGKIQEEDIKVSDLKFFQKAVLINAMLDYDVNNFINMKNIFQRSKL
jgi:4-amino-4-deoxychorismate lyase